MKIKEMLNLREVLLKLSTQEMEINLAYKIMKLSLIFDEEHKFFEKRINKIAEDFGEKDENGQYIIVENNIKIIPVFLEECNKKILELHEYEVEIKKITFTLEELKNLKLSPKDMFALNRLIVGEN